MLMTEAIRQRLIDNYQVTQRRIKQTGGHTPDHRPVLKVFDPSGGATWLFTEFDGEDQLFGLCDLGMGCPELGYASLRELEGVRGKLGLPMERDQWFKATKTLRGYREDAALRGAIRT